MAKTNTIHKDFRENRFQYPFIERVIIGFAFLLIFVFLYLMITNASLRQLFFKTGEEELLSQPIAKVFMIQGNVSRVKASEIEFEKLVNQDLLYPNDTIMTGKGAAVIVELKDGQRIVMEENSLIKLSFDFDFSLSSLMPRQFLTQNVIKKQNEVKVQTKVGKEVKKYTELEFKQKVAIQPIQKIIETAPPPVVQTEVPIKVTTVYNKPNEKIFFNKTDVLSGFKIVSLKFDLSQESEKIKLKIFKNNSEFGVYQIPNKTLNVQHDLKVTTPGEYKWEVINKYGNSISKNQFTIDPMIDGESIIGLSVANLTSKMEGFTTQTVFPGFFLEWKEFEAGTPYAVTIKDLKSNTILANAKSTTNQYVFSKNKIIFDKKMAFKVEQITKNGFRAVSKEYPFSFEYLPPALTSPEKNKTISLESFKGSQKKIFFTWGKTNYAQSYEFQYSEDEKFEDIIITKKLKDNFFVLTNPQEGTFYWRVKAIAEETASAYSESNKLIIKE